MAINKELVKGSTSILVLSLLSREDMYGYQITQTLKEETNNVFEMKEGTLYPILYRLEDDGMIQSSWSQGEGRAAPKKMYSATEKGRMERLRRWQIWETFSGTVNGFYQKEDGMQ